MGDAGVVYWIWCNSSQTAAPIPSLPPSHKPSLDSPSLLFANTTKTPHPQGFLGYLQNRRP